MRKIKVLICGRSANAVRAAEGLLASRSSCSIEVKIQSNGHTDPLHGVSSLPDLLMLCDIDSGGEMEHLVATASEERPALVVFGPGKDTTAIRTAMRAGARDYLTLPLDVDEVESIIAQVAAELKTERGGDNDNLHVFINGKGGSGATFLATNVAHGLATDNHKVTVVDLDLQFAGLCRYLDLTPTHDLLEAIREGEEMDEVSADAFTTKHESGLRLLSSRAKDLHLNSDIDPDHLVAMLQRYRTMNDFVVVDLPRNIDLLNVAVLEIADRISVVTQQSFPHLHDTARLLQILRENLGIDNSKITVVANRYAKDSPIEISDMKGALGVENIVKIPNHYKLTSESVNTGIPLIKTARKSAVSKGLQEYYESIGGSPEAVGGGAANALHKLFRR
jgi:pilus assembly protein CpaE